MMAMLGGNVDKGIGTAEFGRAYVQKTDNEISLLEGWFDTDQEQVWMSHGDHVSKIAPGFEVFGTSHNAPFAIIANQERKLFAVQFHPEVHHTPNGSKLLENFCKMAGFSRDWTITGYREPVSYTHLRAHET